MSEELTSANGERARVRSSGDNVTVSLGDGETSFVVSPLGVTEGVIHSSQDHRHYYAHCRGDEVDIWLNGDVYRISRTKIATKAHAAGGRACGDVMASMPGMVVRVLVSEGDVVAQGDGIAVLESMKMQLTLTAPIAGVVRELSATQNALVDQGAVLARIEDGG